MVRMVEAGSVEERRIASAGSANRVPKFEVGKARQFVLLSNIRPDTTVGEWNEDEDTIRVMQFDHKEVFGFGTDPIKVGDNKFYMTQPLVDPDEVADYVDLASLWNWKPSIGYYLWVAEITNVDDNAQGEIFLWEPTGPSIKQLEATEAMLAKDGMALKGSVINVVKPTQQAYSISALTHMKSSADDYEIAEPILNLNLFANANTMEDQGEFYVSIKDQLIDRCDGVTEENFPFNDDGSVKPEFVS